MEIKFFKRLGYLFIVCLVPALFSSCDSDNDDDKSGILNCPQPILIYSIIEPGDYLTEIQDVYVKVVYDYIFPTYSLVDSHYNRYCIYRNDLNTWEEVCPQISKHSYFLLSGKVYDCSKEGESLEYHLSALGLKEIPDNFYVIKLGEFTLKEINP